MKGISKKATHKDVTQFVKSATPQVCAVHLSNDIYPIHANYSLLAYLNYSSYSEAREAKPKIDAAARIAKHKNSEMMDATHFVTYLKDQGPASAFPVPFGVRLNNVQEEPEAALMSRAQECGKFISIASGLPPFKAFGAGQQRNMIANFEKIEGAFSLLEKCAYGKIVVGKAVKTPVTALLLEHAKFMFDLCQRMLSRHIMHISYDEAEQVWFSLPHVSEDVFLGFGWTRRNRQLVTLFRPLFPTCLPQGERIG